MTLATRPIKLRTTVSSKTTPVPSNCSCPVKEARFVEAPIPQLFHLPFLPLILQPLDLLLAPPLLHQPLDQHPALLIPLLLNLHPNQLIHQPLNLLLIQRPAQRIHPPMDLLQRLLATQPQILPSHRVLPTAGSPFLQKSPLTSVIIWRVM